MPRQSCTTYTASDSYCKPCLCPSFHRSNLSLFLPVIRRTSFAISMLLHLHRYTHNSTPRMPAPTANSPLPVSIAKPLIENGTASIPRIRIFPPISIRHKLHITNYNTHTTMQERLQPNAARSGAPTGAANNTNSAIHTTCFPEPFCSALVCPSVS